MPSELGDSVRRALDVDPEEFRKEAAADAEVVKELLRDGAFDNQQSIVGLEYEFYAAAAGRWGDGEGVEGSLMRVPRRLLQLIGFEKELGLHNAEMTTSPQPFGPNGVAAQAAEVRARLSAALDCTAPEGMRLVSDGMWTIPPAGESGREYLTDSVVDDGIRVATNMSDAVRYHAMANSPTVNTPITIDAPHVDVTADTVLAESLITSIQPHYQMSHAADLPRRFNYALRVAGPLLALGVNSPFFPPDCYEDDADPEAVLADGWQESRIQVFETVMNGLAGAEKVTFPDDLETVEQAVDRIAADDVVVPLPVERGGRFDDRFATLRTKHGTYWRWVRPVFDGASRSAANARIEFRPLPGQPTVADSVALQATFGGLMEVLPQHEHPVADMSHDLAAENFYAAARNGLDADLHWVTHEGVRTTDRAAIYEDLLAHAVAGLESAGFDERDAERYVQPLRHRIESGRTPASWKRDRVRDALAQGESFADAVHDAQRAYIDRQADTLIDGTFADW